jgi:hypothetical protein
MFGELDVKFLCGFETLGENVPVFIKGILKLILEIFCNS